MNLLQTVNRPWIPLPDGTAVHGWTLGKMAALHRRLHGEAMVERAHRAGLRLGQLRIAESRGAMTPATAQKLLTVCGYEAGPFAQPHLARGLRGQAEHEAAARKGRIARVNELAGILEITS